MTKIDTDKASERSFVEFSRTRLRKKIIAGFILIFSILATMHVQGQKVTISGNNISIEQVLQSIRKQTNYQVIYNPDLLKGLPPVTLNMKDVPVATVLEICFKGQNIAFELKYNTLVLKAAKPVETASPHENLDAGIRGKITDTLGNPLEGVFLSVKGKEKYTTSDKEGNFSIDAGKGAHIGVSMVGYDAKEIEITEENAPLAITLRPSITTLDNVVVIGYGTSTKKKLNSAVATLDMTNVAPLPVQSINDAVAGRVQGVIVTSNNGAPGSKSSISIRGGGTPLFVIDGLIRSQGDFENLNPNDIASYSVLMDVSATAIYGQQGANGVILVTTKRGTKGKTEITYSFNQVFSQPTTFPKKVSSYEQLSAINQVYKAEGKTPPTSDSILQLYKNQSLPYVYANTDWQKLALKKFAPEQRHDLSLAAGTDLLHYYASGSYYYQGSDLKTDHSYNKRVTYRLNVESNMKQINLKVIAGIDGYVETNCYPNTIAGSGYGTIYQHIQQTPSSTPAYNELGLPSIVGGGTTPVLELSPQSGYYKSGNSVINSLLTLEYTAPFLKGLTVKATGNYNMYNSTSKSWNMLAPGYLTGAAAATPVYFQAPSLTGGSVNGAVFNIQGIVTYAGSFGDHHIDFTGVLEQSQSKANNLSGSRVNYQILYDQFVAGPTVNQSVSGSESDAARIGYVARLGYNYKMKYFIEGTVRYDGNDILPPNKRWGTFFSGSAGYVLSEEKFMQRLKEKHILDYVKLKGSIGQVGNLPATGKAYYQGYNLSPNAYVINDVPVQGTSEQSTLPSTNYTWYTNNERNLGLDLASLNNRLTYNIGYFYKRITGYVGSDPRYAATLGVGLPPINIGAAATRREGMEFNLTWNDHTKDFTYKLGFNFTYFNTLTERSASENDVNLKNPYTRTSGTTGSFYGTGYHSLGLYQNNASLLSGARVIGSVNTVAGDIQYQDTNGDGKIDASDMRPIGSNTFPSSNYGFTFDLGYKGFFLSGVIMGTGNRDRYLGSILQGTSIQGMLIYSFQQDYWRPDNTSPLFPRQTSSPGVNGNNNTLTSDYWLLKSAFVRLKYLQLGYDFKTRLLAKSAFRQCRVFLSGTNLLTSAKSMKYFIDPESDPANQNYPIQRTIALGASIGF